MRGEPPDPRTEKLGFVSDWNSSRQTARWAHEGVAALNALFRQVKQSPAPMTGAWKVILAAQRESCSGGWGFAFDKRVRL
jgi:hypothetical protein